MYFSKIAQKATHRINYLGYVSSSYAFNHNLETNSILHRMHSHIDEALQVLSENTPICKMSQSIMSYYQFATSISIHDIMNDSVFFTSVFDNQKSPLVKCIRYMLEKNLIVMLDEGSITDESRFIFNDRPNVKGEDIKSIRLRQQMYSS